MISIHALREEGDPAGWCPRRRKSNFYPRPPRGGRRTPCSLCLRWTSYFYPRPPRGGRPSKTLRRERSFRFLSTPSARRATWNVKLPSSGSNVLLQAAPRGGQLLAFGYYLERISIHALREEGDTPLWHDVSRRRWNFYPRPPRATDAPLLILGAFDSISIHALREEGGFPWFGNSRRITDFYPRPPRGGRLCRSSQDLELDLVKFLSTPSARRATWLGPAAAFMPEVNFYPRPPRRRRLLCSFPHLWGLFLSTPSARRAQR